MLDRWNPATGIATLAAILVPVLVTLPVMAQSVQAGGTALHLKVGQSQIFSLPENPSTGYRWQVAPDPGQPQNKVKLTDEGYIRPAATDGRVGAAGTRVWRIEGVAPGTVDVTFNYVRPWQPDDIARQHILTVDVTAN